MSIYSLQDNIHSTFLTLKTLLSRGRTVLTLAFVAVALNACAFGYHGPLDYSSTHLCGEMKAVSQGLDFWAPDLSQRDFDCQNTIIEWQDKATMATADAIAIPEENKIIMTSQCRFPGRVDIGKDCSQLLKHEIAHLLGANHYQVSSLMNHRLPAGDDPDPNGVQMRVYAQKD